MDERWILFFAFFLLVVHLAFGDGVCGNANLEEGEVCDRDVLGGENCTNFNYTGGALECLDDCSGYYFGGCTGEEVCGNGVIGESEICEIGNVRNRTCVDEGYENGTLACSIDCLTYDYSECGGVRAVCGDGAITGNEECEEGDLNNETCEGLGYAGGNLGCSDCMFDTAECIEEVIVEENETEEVNETEIGIGEEVPAGVVGVIGDNERSSSGMSFGTWLLIAVGVLIVGVVLIWLFVYKIKK